MHNLKRILERIDGCGYKAYKELRGKYEWQDYTLFIDVVQGDPFASPSRVRVRVPQIRANFPPGIFNSSPRLIALSDWITRKFGEAIKLHCKGPRGTGGSGLIEIVTPGQEILQRSSIIINSDFVEARFLIGLPAYGRRISGRTAYEMFFEEIPKIVEASLFMKNLDRSEITEYVDFLEDVEFIRSSLISHRLVAFICDNSILPRRSGIDERPMKHAVPFKSPESLRVNFATPHHGDISGMGIPEGITLIVGGGYHGKSTLLRAIERGVYPHILGDGREWAITVEDAFKVRAEDGRGIEKVDISPFIQTLPMGMSTRCFSTPDASGSTSQAANIIEAIESGAKLLLIDEDTSATNFMIRDRRMQQLVRKDKEPITPFVDQARNLYNDLGVSTILVMGGSGDYLDVADNVISLETYIPHEVTQRAREVAKENPTNRVREGGSKFALPSPRAPLPKSFNLKSGKIKVRGTHTLLFGRSTIDLSYVEQLIDSGQTRAIGDTIYYLALHYFDGKRGLKKSLDLLYEEFKFRGLGLLSKIPKGDYALPRKLELASAINRLRTLRVNLCA